MTKEEATRLVDALIDASELACVTDNSDGVVKAQALRDNLRDYIIDSLVASGYTFNTYTSPGIVYRDDNVKPITPMCELTHREVR